MFWVSLFVLSFARELDLLEQEIQLTESLQKTIQAKIQQLKQVNTTHGVDLPVFYMQKGDSWRNYIQNQDADTLGSKIYQRSVVQTSRKIMNFDFLTLRPLNHQKDSKKQLALTGGNVALTVCFEDGVLELYSLSGELLYRYSLGHRPLFCAGTSSADEIKIASVSDNEIRVHRLEMPVFNQTIGDYFGLQSYTTNATIKIEDYGPAFNETLAQPTSLIHYARLGKKHWVMGDSLGRVSLFTSQGKLVSTSEEHGRPITQLERFGQQLTFALNDTVGIFNLGEMAIHQACERVSNIQTLHDISSVTIDYNSHILHAMLRNGELITYDTRFSQNNSPVTCKAISRLRIREPGDYSIAAIRGAVIAWGNGVFIGFNSSFLEDGIVTPPEYYQVTALEDGINSLAKTYRIPSSGFVLALLGSNSTSIAVYDTIAPIRVSPIQQSGESFLPLDFGQIRFIGFILAIGIVAYWQVKKRKTPKQREEERREKTLADLEERLSMTSKAAEGLGSRLKDLHNPRIPKRNVTFAERDTVHKYSDIDD